MSCMSINVCMPKFKVKFYEIMCCLTMICAELPLADLGLIRETKLTLFSSHHLRCLPSRLSRFRPC